jgi:hypothetical protein
MTEKSKRVPCSGYGQTKGLAYFPRMLDKSRLLANDELRDDFKANVGVKMDARMCDFLRVKYMDLVSQVHSGKTDDEVLEWCFQNGRRLTDFDMYVWTAFVTKFGSNDEASQRLEKMKAENGLSGRDDIITFFQFFDVDEGRAK